MNQIIIKASPTMPHTQSLNLLVIDDDQMVAERIITAVKAFDITCDMMIIDEQKELKKALRRQWDIVLYGHAYDISIEDLVSQAHSENVALPIISMISEPIEPMSRLDQSDKRAIEMLQSGVSAVYLRSHLSHIALEIIKQLNYLKERRETQHVKSLLAETEIRANLLLKNSRSAIAYIKEGMHVYVNEPYQKLFGYDHTDDLVGLPVVDLIAGKNVSDFKAFLKRFMKGERNTPEFKFESLRPDGTSFNAKLQLAPATFEGEPCLQIIIQQHNQNAASKEQLAAVARKDNLTGLGNRRAFEEDLKKVRSRAINNHDEHALLYINIDNIGHISASLGFDGADATVIHVGKVLQAHFTDASINRFSDAAFTVIDYDITKEALLEKTQTLIKDIADDLINVEARTAQTTVSIGLVQISDTSPDTSEIFQRAYSGIDRVRKATKGVGNAFHLYDPYANAASSDSAMFEALNKALDNNKFKLLFQPIYHINDDSSNFYEVFLRLPLPNGETLSPDKFLAIAEQAHMLERIDRWVMLNATKILRRELKADPNARLLINLSNSALQDGGLPDFADKLIKAIGSSNFPLTLQFNEHDVLNYLSLAKDQFSAFNQAGCHVSINNFGSSLKAMDIFNHVKPNMVKLDRNYANNLSDSDNLSATQSFVSDIKEHNVTPMMAFLEDAASMSAAWTIGAPYIQGMYLQGPSESMGSENTN